MNTEELEERLDERMQHLADRLPAPVVNAGEDLARGRRRARGRRVAGVAVAAAVGVVVGGTGYLVHVTSSPTTVTPAASGPSVAPSPGPDKGWAGPRRKTEGKTAPGARLDPRLQGFRAAIAAVLDPSGDHLSRVSGELSGGGVLGTRLGWKDGPGEGEVMVTVARPRSGGGGFSLFDSWGCEATAAHPCTPVRLPDGTAGVKQTRTGELGVYYTRPNGQVVLIVETTLFGNDSRFSIDALPATATQLLRAASDSRMTLSR